MMDRPRIDELLVHAGNSRYMLAMIAAKRARQINNYYNSLGDGLGMTMDEFPPPLVTTRSKNLLTISLEEIADGKIGFERPE
jgi:DNA-directed RNA polymerase subunit omega